MLAKHPDPTVDHVLRIWAPRMIVQGIDFNDLMTTANRIRTWDDWPREWCRTAAGHEQYAREAEAQGRRESASPVTLQRRRTCARRQRVTKFRSSISGWLPIFACRRRAKSRPS